MRGNEGPGVGSRGTILETERLDPNRELHHALGVAWLRRAAPVLFVVALPPIAGVSCFKDLLEQPRAPVFKFSVSPLADTIVAGDTVAPLCVVAHARPGDHPCRAGAPCGRSAV